MNVTNNSDATLAEYRKFLVSAEQKSQEDFDKTVLALSGGGLAISLTFLKDVIGDSPVLEPNLLFIAWMAWALSTFSVLTSYFLSHLALRQAIKQVDGGTIHTQRAGNAYAIWTFILNALGGILFLVGVCCIAAFASSNLSTKGESNVRKETSISAAAPPISATAPSVTPTTPPYKRREATPDNRGVHSPSPTSEKLALQPCGCAK